VNVLWLSWKDSNHPLAGGAEVILHELSKKMVSDGHNVTILTALYPGAAQHDSIDGVTIIRVGSNRYLHSFQALFYYLRHLRNKYDVLIEAVNTAPYFSAFFSGKAKSILFYHQLAREIWYLQAPSPLSSIGYWLLEPVATWMLSLSSADVVTVSESTKKDLIRFGFKAKNIRIISEGIQLEPLSKLSSVTKYPQPTILSLGAMREMKQTLDQVKAFEIAKAKLPNLQMKLAGDSSSDYGQQVLAYIAASPHKDSIECLGHVTEEQKIDVMRRSHCITVSSIKEGWGLIVTEAASQGTPAVVYDADGLRDSVKHRQTGLVTDANPAGMADGIVNLLDDEPSYKTIRKTAWQWSKQVTFEQSYKDFMEATRPS
jgi:glycosyltransferase involved in cell wall biosynthesis